MSSNTSLRKFKPLEYSSVHEFKDPDTGTVLKANNRKELIKLIVNYRIQNELEPIENLNIVVENYLCTLPVNNGRCEPNRELHRGFLEYFKGGVALVKNLLYNKMVSTAVADARAAVCVDCPKNIFPDKKGFIAWSDDIAERATGGRKSAHHDSLGNCDVCSCPLRAKVFYGGKLTPTEQEMKEFPEHCWIKREVTDGRHTKTE